ncbi:Hint domain-containing protein [Deinococcus apachensis]|uniref:Hint domain-containing protein n=1 Tax=Deinococcus apachensis TaxID=309886 RepID=UPI00036439D8|nr:Hint domain-containing protein [Deinococcus apachensis]
MKAFKQTLLGKKTVTLSLLVLTAGPALGARHYIDPPDNGVYYACVAEGTQIVLANGTSASIQSIRIGARVTAQANEQYHLASTRARTSPAFVSANVVRTYASRNDQQAYEVRDDKQHRLIGTDDHPIVTRNRGVVTLSALHVGDVLISDTGPSRVTRIAKVQYTGKVYNLLLGTSSGNAKANTYTHTYFANGILVGDMKLQVTLQDKQD